MHIESERSQTQASTLAVLSLAAATFFSGCNDRNLFIENPTPLVQGSNKLLQDVDLFKDPESCIGKNIELIQHTGYLHHGDGFRSRIDYSSTLNAESERAIYVHKYMLLTEFNFNNRTVNLLSDQRNPTLPITGIVKKSEDGVIFIDAREPVK